MGYSPTSYSKRHFDPQVLAWKAAGGNASNRTLSYMSDAMFDIREKDLIYTSSNGSGLVRLNLFCGSDIASVARPLITNGVGNATDTNNGFVAGDYVEGGAEGGLTGDGSSYLDTGVTGNDLDFTADVGAYGCFITKPYSGDGSARAYMGSWDGTNLIAFRNYSTTTNGGQLGATGAEAGKAVNPLPTGLWYLVRESGSVIRLYHGTTDEGNSGFAIDITDAPREIYVMARNATGTADRFTLATLGGYFLWRGGMSSQQRTDLNSVVSKFQGRLGRQT